MIPATVGMTCCPCPWISILHGQPREEREKKGEEEEREKQIKTEASTVFAAPLKEMRPEDGLRLNRP